MHERLTERAIPHKYELGKGGHEWSYWVGDSEGWLSFVEAGFSAR